MPEHLTDKALRNAMVLASLATPGPWEACTWDQMERPHVTTAPTNRECSGRHDAPRTRDDAAFIAAGRTILPAAAQALLDTRAALPDPRKLELLADWFDAYEKRTSWKVIVGETTATEVQNDLRLWAAKARALLDEA